MKRFFALLLAVCLFAFAAGCGDSYKGPEVDVAALAAELAAADIFDDIVSEMPAELAPHFYSYDEADVVACALYQSTLAAAEEVFIVECTDHDAAKRVMESCEGRIEEQIAAYENYVPAEVPKLEGALRMAIEKYVFFVVSNDSDEAQRIVESYLK